VSSAEQEQATRWRVPVAKLRIHNAIVDHLGLAPSDVLLDLGCGNGFTLATAASRVPDVSLVGVDVDGHALAAAASWLDDMGARHQLFESDLDEPLPLPDASVTKVVSHDVLECVADPGALLVEASRVLQPGGTAVWSHVDYESVAVSGADRDLTRRIVEAYAGASDSSGGGGARSDAQMGRRLTALVDRSPLLRTAVDASVLVATDLAGPGGRRIEDIAATVRRAAAQRATTVGPDDVDRWVSELHEAAAQHEFFYSQTAYIVTSRRG
jgi:SAM-dependent methyltransferase